MSPLEVERNDDAEVPRVGGERGQKDPGVKTPVVGGTITAEPARTPVVEAPPRHQSTALPEKDPSRYRLIGEHGRGGIGRVLSAFDEELERSVAVKELQRIDPVTEARFIREAKITARLEHPSIVPVHEAGRWPDGTPFYAMKLVAGRSLKEVIEQYDMFEDRVRLLPNCLAVAEAIAYAHSEGVIHRDLKPSNVIVGDYGETVVVDWGLAKDLKVADDEAPHAGPYRTASNASDAALTHAGDILGTPAYMPPEQARGEEVDERADVYSLGAMLHHVLTGAPPFVGATSADVLASVLKGRAPDLRSHGAIPDELAAIVGKAMKQDPSRRYSTARQMAEDLRRFLNGKLVGAYEYSRKDLVLRWLRRHRRAVVFAGIVLTTAIAAGVWSISRIVDAEKRARLERDASRSAQRVTEGRERQLLVLQASSALRAGDPTAAIAWLKRLGAAADLDRYAADVVAIASDAAFHGVARRVIRPSSRVYDMAFLPGGIVVATGDDGLAVVDIERGRVSYGCSDGLPWLVSASPDMESVATVDVAAGVLRVWRVSGAADPEQVMEYDAGAGIELRPSYSPRAGSVAIATVKGRIVEWAADASSVRTDRMVDGTSASALVHTSTDELVVATSAGELIVLDQERKNVRRRRVHGGNIWSLAPLPDAPVVASAGADGHIFVTEVNGLTTHLVGTHHGEANALVFSPDGEFLVSGGDDGQLVVWSTATWERTCHMDAQGAILGVAISNDGKYVAAAGESSFVALISLDGCQEQLLPAVHDRNVALAFSPTSDSLAAANLLTGKIHLWPAALPARSPLGHHRAAVLDVATTRSGLVLTGSADRTVALWSKQGTRLGEGSVGERQVTHVAIHPSAGYLAAGTEDGVLFVQAGTEFSRGTPMRATPRAPCEGSRFILLEYTADGEALIASCRNGHVAWLSPDGARWLWQGQINGIGEVTAAALSTDGAFVAGCGEGSALVLALDGSGSWKLDRHSGLIGACAFSPDGSRLATGGYDGRVLLGAWREDEDEEESVGVADGHVVAVSFSPDGQMIAASTMAGEVLISTPGGGPARQLRGHSDAVTNVAFSSDGKYLASCSRDGTARLWSARTSHAVVMRHPSRVLDVAFTGDELELASITADGSVVLWRPDDVARSSSMTTPSSWLQDLTAATIGEDGRLYVDPAHISRCPATMQ